MSTNVNIKGSKVEVKQIRSVAARTKPVKATLECLGLGRIGKVQVLPVNDSIKGMIRKVSHLIEIKELD